MGNAYELPTSQLKNAFDPAYVEFKIDGPYPVDDGVNYISGNIWDMCYGDPVTACENYVKAPPTGEFYHKNDAGWFFLAAAQNYEYYPQASDIIYEYWATSGGFTNLIQLDYALNPNDPPPAFVWIWNSTLETYVQFEVFSYNSNTKVLTLYPKDYYEPDNPYPFPYSLYDYGFPMNMRIPVQVFSEGSYGNTGISPGLAGAAIVFTVFDPYNLEKNMIHEMVHAFGLQHKCGFWDYLIEWGCATNYWDHFLFYDIFYPYDDLMQWSNHFVGTNLCPVHLLAIRRAKLENLSGLGWGN